MNDGAYAVYLTSHPDGRFYVGSSSTWAIRAKKYVGSGKLLHEHLKRDAMEAGVYSLCGKTEPEVFANNAYALGWQCEIVRTLLDRGAAYEVERLLIRELGDLPGCLNLTKPGRRPARKPKLYYKYLAPEFPADIEGVIHL